MEKNSIFPSRPKFNMDYRNRQESRKIVTNLFPMKLNLSKTMIYVYSITYSNLVSLDNSNLKIMILRHSAKTLKEIFDLNINTGDNLFSTKKIDEIVTFETVLKSGEELTKFKVEIKLTDFRIDLAKMSPTDNYSRPIKYFIELVLKNILHANNLMRLKNSYFDRDKYKEIESNGYSAKLYSGYKIASCILENSLYCKVSLMSKFINKKNCRQQIKEFEKKCRGIQELQEKLSEVFVGKIVHANYGNYNFHRVDDITFDRNVKTCSLKLKTKNGNMEEITLYDYYYTVYQIKILDLEQPLFIEKKKNDSGEQMIYLVPELLLLTGIGEEIKSSDQFRKIMGGKTILTPSERIPKILKFTDLMHEKDKNITFINKKTGETIKRLQPNQIRKEWGLEISDDLLQTEARYMADPKINLKKNYSNVKNGRVMINSEISNAKFLENKKWVLYYNRKNVKPDDFIYQLQKASERIGIRVESPYFHEHSCRNGDDHINEFKRIKGINQYIIIVVIISRNEKQLYKAIKNELYTKYGILSQVALYENLSKNLSYYTKILLQMNYKMCGELYHIELHDKFKKRSMFVGLDCSKRINSEGRRSYCMTSTYDENCCLHYTETARSSSTNSNYGPVCDMMKKCLNVFQKKRGNLPEFIFVYRSCVSEGEKLEILKEEAQRLQTLLSGNSDSAYKVDYKAKLCFIIVNKQTDMKFFEIQKNDYYVNPASGMVIDSNVVNPTIYEFYIQPQFVNAGSASPTNYHVILDEINVPPEILQEVTYKLNYYYFNWDGAIRIPSVLKYAEVCNKFSATNLSCDVESEELKLSTYYI